MPLSAIPPHRAADVFAACTNRGSVFIASPSLSSLRPLFSPLWSRDHCGCCVPHPPLHTCSTFVATAVAAIAAIAIVATTAVVTAVALIIVVATLFGAVVCDHRRHHLVHYHHDRCLRSLSCDHRCDHRYRLCDYHIVAVITIIIISIVIVVIIICDRYHVIIVVIIAIVSAIVISSLWTSSLWSPPSQVPSLRSLSLLHLRLSSSRHRRCFYHCRSRQHGHLGQGRSRGPCHSRFAAAAALAVDSTLLSLMPPSTLPWP